MATVPSTRLDDAQAPAEASVPEGSLVYAIGDIHGRLDLLELLHDAILADSARSAGRRRVVVYLGDYIDRGPDSRGVVELLVEEPLPGFESVHLKGNHEDLLLRFLDDPAAGLSWLMNGGDATCLSYGTDPLSPPAGANRHAWLQHELTARLPATHLAFFRALRLSHVEGGYLFVHAGLQPGVPWDAQDPEDLMWIREPFLSSGEDHGKVVVHGHTPRSDPVFRRNRVGLDTGACFGGVLTALALEGAERRLLQV